MRSNSPPLIASLFSFGARGAAVALVASVALLPISKASAADRPDAASAPSSGHAGTRDSESSKRGDSNKSGTSAQSTHDESTTSSVSKEVPAADVPSRAAPKPPQPEDQEPRPYVAPVELKGKERHLTLSLVAGSWWHSLNGKGASTSVGPVWGVSGRVDPYRWMGVRVTILRGNQPESPDFGGLGLPNIQVRQHDFQIIHWSIRIEPTWHVSPSFSLWAGPGLGWARAIVPESQVGNFNWISADRACVYVEAEWAVGAEYELLRDWLMLGLDLSAGALGYQHGSAHEPVQAFTPDGHLTHIGGYPNFSHKLQALFGVGVIL